MKVKNNTFAITYNLLIILVTCGILEPIVRSDSKAVRSRHDSTMSNGYFRVVGITNLVWMHVQNGYGVFINEYIVTEQGNTMSLVEELSKYYWYIDKQHWIVKAGDLSNRAIWRCIGSLILYGDIKQKMPRWLEVHHKWWRWCNAQETMSFVCKRRHQRFHSRAIASRASHRKGEVVVKQQKFKEWEQDIKTNILSWKHISM